MRNTSTRVKREFFFIPLCVKFNTYIHMTHQRCAPCASQSEHFQCLHKSIKDALLSFNPKKKNQLISHLYVGKSQRFALRPNSFFSFILYVVLVNCLQYSYILYIQRERDISELPVLVLTQKTLYNRKKRQSRIVRLIGRFVADVRIHEGI